MLNDYYMVIATDGVSTPATTTCKCFYVAFSLLSHKCIMLQNVTQANDITTFSLKLSVYVLDRLQTMLYFYSDENIYILFKYELVVRAILQKYMPGIARGSSGRQLHSSHTFMYAYKI